MSSALGQGKAAGLIGELERGGASLGQFFQKETGLISHFVCDQQVQLPMQVLFLSSADPEGSRGVVSGRNRKNL